MAQDQPIPIGRFVAYSTEAKFGLGFKGPLNPKPQARGLVRDPRENAFSRHKALPLQYHGCVLENAWSLARRCAQKPNR